MDRIQDVYGNSLLHNSMILYGSGDISGEEFPRIDKFVSGDCPSPGEMQHIRPLTGRYYLATTGR